MRFAFPPYRSAWRVNYRGGWCYYNDTPVKFWRRANPTKRLAMAVGRGLATPSLLPTFWTH